MIYSDNCTLVWSFRNRFDVFQKSIISAHQIFPKNIHFCCVDAGSNDDTIKNLRRLANSITDRKIRICESIYRTSLSEAWNLGIMLSNTRYVIFASSDVEFLSHNLFDMMVEENNKTKCKYLLVQNHAVFLLDKTIIPDIGWFDENFEIGPHFDCDYMIRASEKGYIISNIPNVGYYVHEDDNDMIIKRTNEEVVDRLPMHEYVNEKIFKNKWKSSWPGWEPYKHVVDKPHPPTHISQVLRLKSEIDPHPLFTKKYEK